MIISENSKAEDLIPIAKAIHILVNKLPITMRSKNYPGVRLEKGEVVDKNFEGYVLKLAIEKGEVIKATPIIGPYKGLPVIVVPIKENDKVVGAVGVVDITAGIFEDILAIARRPELYKFLPEDAYPR
ncbi:hypothetical protein J422_06170 [Methanocaldococcus villosus KIN24-T80]|uniref:DUF2111 domain-containing protein n=1 Tax=Methanocaldococcus villosus KIN24-T80 TaxID=1069083 RepID=N6VXB3_9EURY|nr:DUF2111 domain-containing protein [Methanocaldococcus villosus]ENN95762.1 hypothetical protein J422_06170 [Methanocaldococcus villosus KIN24-T80]